MTTPVERAPSAPGYAFRFGLPRDVTLRLLSGQFSKTDYRLYLATEHWQATKAAAMDAHGRACCLCDTPLALQVHHRPVGYRHLFREDVRTHLAVLCSRCHRRHHRR